MLKVRIKDITPDVKNHVFALEAAWFQEVMRDVEGAWAEASGEVHVALSRKGPEVLARGEVCAHFAVPCARCLEDAPVAVQAPFAVTFLPRGREPEGDLLDEPDFEAYEGDEIDLRGLVRDSIVLGIPIATLCRAECKGLCPQCGAPLNQGECGCRPPATTPGEPAPRVPRHR